jgi:hypothetical protein
VLPYKVTAVVTEAKRGGDKSQMRGDVVPLRLLVTGKLGSVYAFIRNGGRTPAIDFLDGLERGVRKQFDGSFDALTKLGADYENRKRFKGLHSYGKPLWEFKEHAPRIYAVREIVVLGDGDRRVQIAVAILLDGWKKEKEGKAKEEPTRIASALKLYREYLDAGVKDKYGNETSLGTATERANRR